MLRNLAFLIAWALACSLPAAAQVAAPGRSHQMAVQDVPAGATTVRIDLSRGVGAVRALRLVATNGALIVDKATITYANGQIHFQEGPEPLRLARSQSSPDIDVRDAGRFADLIELKLRPSRQAVRVEVWAVQTETDRAAVRRDPQRTRSFDVRPTAETPSAPSRPTDDRSRSPVNRAPYAEVTVLYGTNRRPEAPRKLADRVLASYGTTTNPELLLGRAVVTVPTEGRTIGQLNSRWTAIISFLTGRGTNPDRDFTMLAVDQMPSAQFTEAARQIIGVSRKFEKQAIVFVHGYNVSFDDALFRAAQIKVDTGFDGLPLVFSWPAVGGFYGAIGYNQDQKRANAAKDALREFLDLIAAETGATKIHLIAHSMGANPILGALQTYVSSRDTNRLRFGEVILAAPDILRDEFEAAARRIHGLARGITLFASTNDRALQASSLFAANPAGFIPSNAPPVIANGVDTIDVSALNTDFLGINHSTYSTREELIKDIARLIADQVRRKPGERQPRYLSVPVPAGGSYWRFKP